MTQSADPADRPPWALTVEQAGDRVAAGTLSPVELLDSVLARIAAIDDRVHAYLHVAAAQARTDAERAAAEIAAGRWRGPLHGLPFAVKDNCDVAGMPATAGSRLRLDNVPGQDAAMVARMRAAGAVLVGKLSTWEFGTGNGGEYFDLPFPPRRATPGTSSGSPAAPRPAPAPRWRAAWRPSRSGPTPPARCACPPRPPAPSA